MGYLWNYFRDKRLP
ncbi:uncharacterized protein FTOL_13994 [Fusarium torulosum]|uniref:Uncharacterized protein n=1 Tax=Fusarium torulosum TaxID=33205 RepID=A0AAE8MQ07_9HYPO|nr:uncharacterized protein FTOL_13994 [Fusarium torulosum]